MRKSSAGIVACAIAALALRVTSAHAQPVDLVDQYVTSSSGPSPSSGPSSGGGSSSSTRSGLDDTQAEYSAPTASEETATLVDAIQPPDATTTSSDPTTSTTTETSTPTTDPTTTTTDPTTITEPPATTTTDSTTDRHGDSSHHQPHTYCCDFHHLLYPRYTPESGQAGPGTPRIICCLAMGFCPILDKFENNYITIGLPD